MPYPHSNTDVFSEDTRPHSSPPSLSLPSNQHQIYTNFNIFICVESFILLRLHIEVEQARELLSTVQERIQIRRENT